jgi:hypothetical protein
MNIQMVNGIGNNSKCDGLSSDMNSQMVNEIVNNVNNFNYSKKVKKSRYCFDLSVLHWNCNGLSSKIEQLKSYLLKKNQTLYRLMK